MCSRRRYPRPNRPVRVLGPVEQQTWLTPSRTIERGSGAPADKPDLGHLSPSATAALPDIGCVFNLGSRLLPAVMCHKEITDPLADICAGELLQSVTYGRASRDGAHHLLGDHTQLHVLLLRARDKDAERGPGIYSRNAMTMPLA